MTPEIVGVLQTGTVTDAFGTAFTAFLTSIFAFIPNIIGAAITLIVGYVVIRIVTTALRVGMQKSHVDAGIARTELGSFLARSGQTFSALIVRIVRAVMWLIVAVYAVSVLGIASLTASMMGILAWIPNLVAAGIIVVAGVLIAGYAGKLIGDNLSNYGMSGGRLIGLAVKFLIYALVFDFALIQLGFGQGIIYTTTTALSWGLAAALAVGLGVPIAYSLKGPMTAMASGSTTIASTLKPGQRITVDGIENAWDHGRVYGTVKSVGMFNTVIESASGERSSYMILPNSLLTDRPIMVESSDVPKIWDDGIRDQVSDLDNRFDGQAEPSGPARSEPAQTKSEPREVPVQAH